MALITVVRGRLRLPFVLALISAMLGAVLFLTLSSGGAGADRVPSTAQVQAATSWLRRIRLPAAATKDLSDTPCTIAVELCVTARVSTRQLAVELRAAFDSQGGAPGHVDCTGGPSANCLFFAGFGGARIAVVAQAITGYLNRSSVAFAAIQHVNSPPPPPQALPALESLRALPGGVHLHVRCAVRLGIGCERYAGRFGLRGNAGNLARRWRARLHAAGWLTYPWRCDPIAGGQRCRVAAVRSLEPDGARFVSIIADPSDSAHGNVQGALSIVALG